MAVNMVSQVATVAMQHNKPAKCVSHGLSECTMLMQASRYSLSRLARARLSPIGLTMLICCVFHNFYGRDLLLLLCFTVVVVLYQIH